MEASTQPGLGMLVNFEVSFMFMDRTFPLNILYATSKRLAILALFKKPYLNRRRKSVARSDDRGPSICKVSHTMCLNLWQLYL